MARTESTPSGYMGRRTKTRVKCPRCGQDEMTRVARHGFWQERILPLFGRYPWQCAICGANRMLHRRGGRVRITGRERDAAEPEETAGEHVHQY